MRAAGSRGREDADQIRRRQLDMKNVFYVISADRSVVLFFHLYRINHNQIQYLILSTLVEKSKSNNKY